LPDFCFTIALASAVLSSGKIVISFITCLPGMVFIKKICSVFLLMIFKTLLFLTVADDRISIAAKSGADKPYFNSFLRFDSSLLSIIIRSLSRLLLKKLLVNWCGSAPKV